MKTKTSLLFGTILVSGLFLHTGANAANTCHDLSSVDRSHLISNPADQALVKENILNGCDPAFPPKQGGMTGNATPQNAIENRLKTPPDAPSLKYNDVAKAVDPSNPNCNANFFGAPGGKSGDGTTNQCDGGSLPIPAVPITVPPDYTNPPPRTKGEISCLVKLATTFDTGGDIVNSFSQLCAYAGVNICGFVFDKSGCIGDQDGEGGPAPPEGFFTYTGLPAKIGLDKDFMRGPYYLYYGGTLTLPDDTIINIDPERFVWLDDEKGIIYVYDSTPTTYYEYTFPVGSTDTVLLTAIDSVIYVSLCALDDSCFPAAP